MKSAKRTNGKRTNFKLNDLKPKKDPQAGTHSGTRPGPGRPCPDGRGMNHNEMFLVDVS